MAKSIFVADDEATAKRYGLSAEGPYQFYFKQLVRKLVMFGRANLFKLDQSEPDDKITPESITNKLVIAGTVDNVVDQLLAFREKIGDFGTLVYACHDWMDPALGEALDAAHGRAGHAAAERRARAVAPRGLAPAADTVERQLAAPDAAGGGPAVGRANPIL